MMQEISYFDLQEDDIVDIVMTTNKKFHVKILDTNHSFIQVAFVNGKTGIIERNFIKSITRK